MTQLEHVVKKENEYCEGKALSNLHVNMSNILIRAAHGVTLNEKRLLSCAIAKLDSTRVGVHPGFNQMKVKLSAIEFAKTCTVDEKIAYREMISASDRFFKRYIRILRHTPKGKKEHKFHWFSGVTYHHGEGWVELNFSPEVTPHLTLLRREYTSYRLKVTAALRSIYTWRLFELLKSASKKKQFEGELYITLEDFRQALDIPSSYKWSNIKQKAIQPAIKELTEKDNLKITWKPVKKSRSVTSLAFFFEKESQQHLDL